MRGIFPALFFLYQNRKEMINLTLSKQYGKYIVTLTKHSLKRIIERNIPGNKVVNTILTAAEQNRIDNSEILIENREENFSLVVVIKGFEITLVTAINKISCYMKENTARIAV